MTNQEMREGIVREVWQVCDYLYATQKPGDPQEYTAIALGEELGLSHPVADSRAATLQELGILARVIHYGRLQPNGTYKMGRFAMWNLLMEHGDARVAVTAWEEAFMAGEVFLTHSVRSAKLKKKPTQKDQMPAVMVEAMRTGRSPGEIEAELTVLATNDKEDTKAIAGPDAPSPMAALAPLRKADDATALIAAARQYATRTDTLADRIAALKTAAAELGIEIDEAAMMRGIHVVPDERLETVSLVLPVINTLESKVERLSAQVAELKAKAKMADDLAVDNRRLRTRVDTLISNNVLAKQQAQA